VPTLLDPRGPSCTTVAENMKSTTRHPDLRRRTGWRRADLRVFQTPSIEGERCRRYLVRIRDGKFISTRRMEVAILARFPQCETT
jgi:hypothetical protein